MNKEKNQSAVLMKLKKAYNNGGFISALMLAPAVFLLVVVSIYPFIWMFRYVAYDYNGFKAYYTGAHNFERIFRDKIFWQSVIHTFEYASMKLIIIIPVSLLLAVLLTQKIKGSNLLRGIYFLPTVISSAVYSLIFGFIFAVFNGVLNASLQSIGLIQTPIDWLGDTKIVMLSIILVAVWGGYGNYMILFASGMTTIPEEIYESGKIDGANGIQSFFYLTLPMLSPVLKVILMLAITSAFKDYESIMVLTNGGPNNRSQVMFSYIFNLIFSSTTQPQIGYATLLSVVAAMIIGAVTAIYLYFAKKLDDVI